MYSPNRSTESLILSYSDLNLEHASEGLTCVEGTCNLNLEHVTRTNNFLIDWMFNYFHSVMAT